MVFILRLPIGYWLINETKQTNLGHHCFEGWLTGQCCVGRTSWLVHSSIFIWCTVLIVIQGHCYFTVLELNTCSLSSEYFNLLSRSRKYSCLWFPACATTFSSPDNLVTYTRHQGHTSHLQQNSGAEASIMGKGLVLPSPKINVNQDFYGHILEFTTQWQKLSKENRTK